MKDRRSQFQDIVHKCFDEINEESSNEDKADYSSEEMVPSKPILVGMAGDFNTRTGSTLTDE